MAGACALALAASGAAHGDVGTTSHEGSEIEGHSTLERTICPTVALCPDEAFTFLRTGPGESHFVREELARARPGRDNRRRSLAYLTQLTDFQLSDEESPARVEFLDNDPSETASSAWRPQEALVAQEVDRTIRQVNRFLRSPVRQGNGARAPMLNAVLTGDLADNQQRNETEWVVQLLEGGEFRGGKRVSSEVDPSSGTTDLNGLGCPLLGAGIRDYDDPRKYTGVQDYDDYPGRAGDDSFYDPDEPERYDNGNWPKYTGLMDRAQKQFSAEGLKVPSYTAFGNHDNLVQGNEDANQGFEEIATGCIKPLTPNTSGLGSVPDNLVDGLPPFGDILTQANLLKLLASGDASLVPRDEQRQFVDKFQFKELHDTGKQADEHGFRFVDGDEFKDSNGTASYYDFSPKKGVRYIVLDTVSEGGVTPQSSDGNLDDPQFKWLEDELARAQRRNELILVFGHHAASSSLTSTVPDEVPGPCVAPEQDDPHNHDTNPGCDRDPRASTPLHDGDDLIELFHEHPNVVTYVAGHSHENQIQGFKNKGGGDFWEIKSPAVVEWPPQHRLLELMDNRDGTLSIFGTLLDFAAPVDAPRSSDDSSVFGDRTLASIGRTLTYNDPQQGPDGSQGARRDRNVELLLEDPRAEADDDDSGRDDDGAGRDDDGSNRGDGSGGSSRSGGEAGGGSGRSDGGGGLDTASSGGGEAFDDTAATGDGAAGESALSDDGGLPVTGLALGALLLLGAVLGTAGAVARRRLRRESPDAER